MRPGRSLREARRRAGLSQRELAERAEVAQSTVARIETGDIDPKASTLDALLRVCGYALESMPKLGDGVDRTLIAEMLKLTPAQRVRAGAQAAVELARFREAFRKGERRPASTRS